MPGRRFSAGPPTADARRKSNVSRSRVDYIRDIKNASRRVKCRDRTPEPSTPLNGLGGGEAARPAAPSVSRASFPPVSVPKCYSLKHEFRAGAIRVNKMGTHCPHRDVLHLCVAFYCCRVNRLLRVRPAAFVSLGRAGRSSLLKSRARSRLLRRT